MNPEGVTVVLTADTTKDSETARHCVPPPSPVVHAYTEDAVVHPANGVTLCGMLYAPTGGIRAAVVFCDPAFEERKSAQRVLVETARAWAAAGVAVLRFDYSGTGDSPGTLAETTPERWTAEVTAAVSWLRNTVLADTPLGLLGVRFGSAVALRAAEGIPDLRFLILWEPVLRGADYLLQELRKKLMKEMVTFGGSQVTRESLLADLRSGKSIDFDGYEVTSAFFAGLESFDQPPARLPAGLAVQIVSVNPGGLPAAPHTKLGEALTVAGAKVQVDGRRLPPFWNLIGHTDCGELIRLSAGWVNTVIPETVPPASTPSAPPAPRTAADGEAFVTVAVGAETVRAVLHRPTTSAVDRKTGLVFLHGWSGGRLGPHRMFVKLARRLAAQGFTCLRPDFRGRGDSDEPAGGASIQGMISDTRAAVDRVLAADTGVERVLLLGICSGGKVAVGAAAADRRIHGLMLWSAEPAGHLRATGTNRSKTWFALRTYLRKLTSPSTWKKILTGNVNVKQVGKAAFQHETRSAAEAEQEERFLKQFREEFKGPILFIYGSNDPETRHAAENYRHFCTANRFTAEFHEIAGANHSFYSLAWEQQVMDLTAAWLAKL